MKHNLWQGLYCMNFIMLNAIFCNCIAIMSKLQISIRYFPFQCAIDCIEFNFKCLVVIIMCSLLGTKGHFEYLTFTKKMGPLPIGNCYKGYKDTIFWQLSFCCFSFVPKRQPSKYFWYQYHKQYNLTSC